MRTFDCSCNNRLFFHDSRCVKCGATVGRCDACRHVVSLKPQSDDQFQCGNDSCKAILRRCSNSVEHAVCNGTSAVKGNSLCSYCSLNEIIPDLTIPANVKLWQRLEFAKHRVLYIVESLGLPLDSDSRKLRFAFLAETAEPVATGHTEGLITINLLEADAVEREKTRVQFGEPHRTLVGHFRHELGHYYWDLLVKPNRLEEFRQIFGNEFDSDYEVAKDRYYNSGPAAKWSGVFISEYASMHPWEDFAETFNAYLDMASVLDTARNFAVTKVGRDFREMIDEYRRIGILANEWNRDMGLIDLVPEVFTKQVTDKLQFVHSLTQ